MIVLDTNVLSEMTKAQPSPAVTAWLNRQPPEALFVTAVTIAEMGFGIAALPGGKRREALSEALAATVNLFGDRVLPFDTNAALQYAELAVKARQAGRGFPVADGFIAAIAATHGFAVATRDSTAFAAANLVIINPWNE